MLSSIVFPRSNALNNIKLDAKKKLMFSNNITQLNVVSSLEEANIDRRNLTHITIGQNVSALLPQCFSDCSNLVEVKSSNTTENGKLKDIGNRAFYNCTALTSVDAIGKGNKTKLYNIGLSAFANSGIKEAYISLSGTSTTTQIQSFAFANCKNLTSVTNVGSNYLADYEFAGCTSLAKITFANSHSFVGSYAFMDCSSLSNVEIPQNTWAIGDGMFKGCTSLTSISFKEPSAMKGNRCIGDDILSGAPLTSLTFPSSLNEYSCFSDFSLRGLDKLKEIHFNGMSISDIVNVSNTSKKIKYQFGYIYSAENPSAYYSGDGYRDNIINKNNYSTYFKNVSVTECINIINYCMQNNVPFICIAGNLTAGCGHCNSFAKTVLGTSVFLSWLKSTKNNCIIVDVSHPEVWSYSVYRKLYDELKPSSSLYPHIFMYWMPKGSKTPRTLSKQGDNYRSNPKSFISAIEKTFNGATRPSDTTIIINSDIYGSGCFGLYHNVKLFSRDGQSIVFNATGTSPQDSFTYQSMEQVDHITKDNFKVGQWYFNAIQLKKFADDNQLPVFCYLGSTSCPPCSIFDNTIFSMSSFQKFIRSTNMLLCKIKEPNFTDEQGSFLQGQWMHKLPLPPNDIGEGYLEGVMPIMMIYWYRKNGAYDGTNFIPATLQTYSHFNNHESRSSSFCPWLSSYDDVINWISSVWEPYQTIYAVDSKFKRPSIKSYSDYPKYKMYSNQNNDTYGRYFPVKQLRAPKDYESFQISVLNSLGNRQAYSLQYGVNTGDLPPAGTYQCFTMLSNASYAAQYDLSGIIFKVAGNINYSIARTYSYAYGQKTLQQFEDSIGFSSKITSQTSSFDSSIYLNDDEGDPTTNLDPSYVENTDLVRNIDMICYVNGLALNGKNISQIDIFISSQPHIYVNDDGQKEIEPYGSAYVLSCVAYGYETSQRATLQWLSVFNNVENI